MREPTRRRRRRTREPRFALFLFLIGATILSACGESEPEAGARCPGQERVEPAGARLVTLFHETHTHGNLTTFAEYVGHLSALRACLPDSDNSLFLGNGDDISPGLGNVSTDGRHVIDAFDAAGLDVDTFGFNEIFFGEGYDPPEKGTAQVRELVGDSRFSWVSANVREKEDPSFSDAHRNVGAPHDDGALSPGCGRGLHGRALAARWRVRRLRQRDGPGLRAHRLRGRRGGGVDRGVAAAG